VLRAVAAASFQADSVYYVDGVRAATKTWSKSVGDVDRNRRKWLVSVVDEARGGWPETKTMDGNYAASL
jgi:hypothetical protein